MVVVVMGVEERWAVLVAGSKGMWNYRHQSDVCAAYRRLRENGIEEEKIIVMAVDDIVYDYDNIFPGEMFHEPDGQNVYEGCKIDHREVTPETLKAVLTGNKTIGKRVLESNSSSNVFLYFSDHGELGFLVFPEHQALYADELLRIFEQMNYNKLVVYIEACHSASLFENLLPTNTSIYAMVAADS